MKKYIALLFTIIILLIGINALMLSDLIARKYPWVNEVIIGEQVIEDDPYNGDIVFIATLNKKKYSYGEEIGIKVYIFNRGVRPHELMALQNPVRFLIKFVRHDNFSITIDWPENTFSSQVILPIKISPGEYTVALDTSSRPGFNTSIIAGERIPPGRYSIIISSRYGIGEGKTGFIDIQLRADNVYIAVNTLYKMSYASSGFGETVERSAVYWIQLESLMQYGLIRVLFINKPLHYN